MKIKACLKKPMGHFLTNFVKSLFAASWSHDDQDGRYAHIWEKSFKNLLLWILLIDFHETWYLASGTPAHRSLFK